MDITRNYVIKQDEPSYSEYTSDGVGSFTMRFIESSKCAVTFSGRAPTNERLGEFITAVLDDRYSVRNSG